jgi:hypothetical protein
MTACITLIPTKVSAVTLTVIPGDEIATKPGDSIEFSFVLTPDPGSVVRFIGLGYFWDVTELSISQYSEFTLPTGSLINNPTIVDRRTFNVLTPVKDGDSDVGSFAFYDELDSLENSTKIITGFGPDVVPVPEPLTIFGTAIGLGCGVLFKRKSSKKAVS